MKKAVDNLLLDALVETTAAVGVLLQYVDGEPAVREDLERILKQAKQAIDLASTLMIGKGGSKLQDNNHD